MTATPARLPVGGGVVAFSYVVTNIGNVPLASVAVRSGGCAPVRYAAGDLNGDSLLQTGERWQFTCSGRVAQSAGVRAIVTAQANGRQLNAIASAAVAVTESRPEIHVVAAGNPVSLPAVGGGVAYTYIVTNAGNVPLSEVTVSDSVCSPVAYLSGDVNSNSLLDEAEAWHFNCSATLESTSTNVATAVGHFGGTVVRRYLTKRPFRSRPHFQRFGS